MTSLYIDRRHSSESRRRRWELARTAIPWMSLVLGLAVWAPNWMARTSAQRTEISEDQARADYAEAVQRFGRGSPEARSAEHKLLAAENRTGQ
jgi:hypothetical protein